jgi:hypothetical protein
MIPKNLIEYNSLAAQRKTCGASCCLTRHRPAGMGIVSIPVFTGCEHLIFSDRHVDRLSTSFPHPHAGTLGLPS